MNSKILRRLITGSLLLSMVFSANSILDLKSAKFARHNKTGLLKESLYFFDRGGSGRIDEIRRIVSSAARGIYIVPHVYKNSSNEFTEILLSNLDYLHQQGYEHGI